MQRFGGTWTEAKLRALEDYLGAFTTALKARGFKLMYLDAFAGSGDFLPTRGGAVQPGSARRALGVDGLHEYHFIEKSARRCESLRQVVTSSTKRAQIHAGDANAELLQILGSTNWQSTRAVLFLDPYGMQVAWSTLEEVARTRAIDVWYLFPLSGITRQLTLDEANMDDDKRRSLTRVLGTDQWREAFYDTDPPADLFGGQKIERHASVDAIEKWVTRRLSTVFPLVVGPAVLRKGSRGRSDQGPALYALYFLGSNPSPKAHGLAKKIANGVLEKLRRESGVASQDTRRA